MKRVFLMSFFCLSLSLIAQNKPYYKDVVLKTNVLSPISLGIEFPFKDNLSVEYTVRRGGTFVFSKNTYRDERLNLKYHMPLNVIFDKQNTFYLMLGIHHQYRELDNKIHRTNQREYGVLDQNRLAYGLGLRYRFIDVWMAAETVFFERQNFYELRDQDGSVQSRNYWKSGGGLFVGLSINFLNIEKLKSKF
jgi:hypothetical protein